MDVDWDSHERGTSRTAWKCEERCSDGIGDPLGLPEQGRKTRAYSTATHMKALFNESVLQHPVVMTIPKGFKLFEKASLIKLSLLLPP